MTDKIKMDYGLMEEMAKTFQQGAEQLKETRAEMQQVSAQLADGALLGRGGSAFTDAINGKLCPSIDRLTAKFQELQSDVLRAMRDMQAADEESKQQFGR